MAIPRSTLVTKAQELMNTEGLDYAAAARKARDLSTPTAPVVGVPPAPTTTPPVTTTTPITPAPVTPPAPVAPQVTGVDGQKFTQAPVDTTTGLSKPIEPTTPVTPTTAPEVDKTAEIKAQTESKLVENQQKAQLEETKRQAIAKETAQANVPTSQQDILNTLVSGAGVQPQKTQAYRAAQFMYNKYSKFNAMTPTQLESSLKQGQIGTEMDKLLSQNPSYIQAKQKFDNANRIESLNNTMSGIVSGVTGTTTEPVDEMQALGDKIIKSLNLTDETYADAYTKYVAQNPQVVEYTQQLSNINRDIADTTTLLNEGYKQLKKDYPTMSAPALITLMGSRFQDANDTLTNLNNTKTYLKADLTTALEMGKAQYDAVSKDIDNAMSQRNSVISQIVQSQFSLATKQAGIDMERENAKKIAEEALNDPATAISNIMATYAEMGIPFTESIQTKVANAEEFIANGGTLAGYIDKMIKDVQAKPLYKSMVDAQMRILASEAEKPVTQKWGVIGKDAQGNDKYGFINESTGTVTPYLSPTGEVTGDLRYLADQFPNQAWAKNNNPAGITWNSNFDKGTGTAKLLADAGIQFTKGTARPANEGGNYVTFATIEDGLRAQQIMMTQTYGNSTVGNMLASWVGTSEGPNYAKQVAGMAGITDLGAKVSSLTPEQLSALQMAKIQKESPGLAKLLTQGTGTTGTQVTPEAQSWVNAWNNGTMDIETILTKIGTSKEAMGLKNQVIKAIDEQGGVAWRKENDPTVKNVEKLYNTATDLLSNKEQLQNVSGGIQMSPWDSLTKKKQTYLSNIQNLLDTNTLQQLIDAKSQGATFGALSNEELKMLQASASSLAAAAERDEKGNIVGFRLTEKELEKKLKELQTQYLDKISRMTGAGIKSNQEEIPTAPSQSTQTNTGAVQTYQSSTGKNYSF